MGFTVPLVKADIAPWHQYRRHFRTSAPVTQSPMVDGVIQDPNFKCDNTVSIKTPWALPLGCNWPPCFLKFPAKVSYVEIQNPSDELKIDTHLTFTMKARSSGAGPCFMGGHEIPCGFNFKATHEKRVIYAVCIWDGNWFMGTGSSSATITTHNTRVSIKDSDGRQRLETIGTGSIFDINIDASESYGNIRGSSSSFLNAAEIVSVTAPVTAGHSKMPDMHFIYVAAIGVMVALAGLAAVAVRRYSREAWYAHARNGAPNLQSRSGEPYLVE